MLSAVSNSFFAFSHSYGPRKRPKPPVTSCNYGKSLTIQSTSVFSLLRNSLEGYYDGTIFHRVVKGFIVQGGDPEGQFSSRVLSCWSASTKPVSYRHGRRW